MLEKDQVPELLTLLAAEIEAQRTYHHHKETMAYSATAASGTLLLLAHQAGATGSAPAAKVLLCVAVVTIGLAVMLFVKTQFRNKWTATDREVAYHRATLRLIARHGLEDTKPPDGQHQDVDFSVWPRFIREEIDAERRRAPRAFSKMLTDPRWHTEMACYLFIGTMIALSLAALSIDRRDALNAGRVPCPSAPNQPIQPTGSADG